MKKITEQSLVFQREKIQSHETRLNTILKEARELREEIAQAKSDYEEMENTFLFGK